MSQMRLEGSFLKWMPFHMSFPLKSDSYKIKKKGTSGAQEFELLLKNKFH